jgi:hypothetical protein
VVFADQRQYQWVNTMKGRLQARPIFLFCLSVSVLSLTACSYGTNFVVVNASDHPVEVRYKIKKPADPRAPSRMPIQPAIKAVSEVNQEVPWRELPASRYTFDPDTRTVVVSLQPGDALLVDHIRLADKDYEASDLSVEEINITGAFGEIKLQGAQVFKNFVADSKKLHTLTYR